MNFKVLLKPENIEASFPDWEVEGVLNPGGTRMKNGKIVLYVRVAEKPIYNDEESVRFPIIVSEKKYETAAETVYKRRIERKEGTTIYMKGGKRKLTHISHFRKVILDESGFNIEHIDKMPSFVGRPKDSEYGVEDPRITKIGEKYYMTYVTVSDRNGVSTSLAESKDLVKWARRGVIFQEQNKDVVLFPEKIKGLYVALNRPESSFVFSKSSVWISYSPDLIFWGKEKALLRTRNRSWETERNGAGPPPIKTKKGWLLIYHGVKTKSSGSIYSAGAVLLGLKNPEKILARTPINMPLLSPTSDYEKEGFMSNVVFPTVAVEDTNKKDLIIYSGGADSVITARKISLNKIFSSLEKA